MQPTRLADNSNGEDNSEVNSLAAIQDRSFVFDVSVKFTFQAASNCVIAPLRRSKPSIG